MTPSAWNTLTRLKVPPLGWPGGAIVAFAQGVLKAAVSSVDAADLQFAWTVWPSLLATSGKPDQGTWRELCVWLDSTRIIRVAEKRAAIAWSPARFIDNRRVDAATLSVHALVFDCDDHGDWEKVLAFLADIGMAYVAHRSPSHVDGGPCKWRLVIPLARPVEGPELAKWGAHYAACRVLFSAISDCWFDHTTGNPSRIWFAATPVGDAPERELRVGTGKAFDLDAFAALAATLYAAAPVRASPPPSPIPLAGGDIRSRARSYLVAAGPAVEGAGGDLHTFKMAAALTRDFGLSDEDALELMRDWNTGCQPPWTEGELCAKVVASRRNGKHPGGSAAVRPQCRVPAGDRVHGSGRPKLGSWIRSVKLALIDSMNRGETLAVVWTLARRSHGDANIIPLSVSSLHRALHDALPPDERLLYAEKITELGASDERA